MRFAAAKLSRRALLLSASLAALCAASSARAAAPVRDFATPFPLSAVRLKPSIFLDAVNANRRYLASLEPDRFLHNFRVSAGLAPKGEMYGGWEGRGIAGHSLGHYLSACALMYAQTGDEGARARVRYIVAELATCQSAHGDGYVGGTTVERDGRVVDGKIVYEEVRRGQIHAGPFDVNGGWVPLYTWHKVHQGLLDAHAHCANAQALEVARAASDYLIGVFAALDDGQVQQVLAAEHGGLNETYAEMFARTGEVRYLDMAERLRHRAVLDPITAERDELAGLHANTQIPKVIGLARLHELTGAQSHARAARFFWNTVTGAHSYAIGGNSEREHFAAPHVIAPLRTERTCEHCNSYNMLKLTRHLWSWRQDAAYFDYFERTHLNHVMAAQNPRTGLFVYFMPMSAGARRQYSTPTETFWCCIGSGMESHAKHGESLFWRRDETLFVNLFVPATLDWAERGARFDLSTDFPNAEDVHFTVESAGARPHFAIALRLPAWCAAPRLQLNGAAVAFSRRDNYAVISRRWRDGDRLAMTLPMSVKAVSAPDDPRLFVFESGPLVLAADLGEGKASSPLPALTDSDPSTSISRDESAGAHVFRIADARPSALTLRPYFSLYESRTAPYLRQTSDAEWATIVAAFNAAQAEQAALDQRTRDMIQLGDVQAEQTHAYSYNQADLMSYEGITGRQAWWGVGNYIEFDMAVAHSLQSLHVLYWGDEINKDFNIKIDGQTLARERRAGPAERRFVAREYPLPAAMTRGKRRVRVRFETRGSDAPIYQVRIVTPAS